MRRRNFSNFEEEIKDIVQNAINTRNFNQLNRDIENMIGRTISDVKNTLNANRDRIRFDQSPYKNNYSDNRRYDEQNTTAYNHDIPRHARTHASTINTGVTAYPTNPIGKVSGILFTVFGWIFLSISSISILVLTLMGFIMHNLSLFGSIALAILPFLLVSIIFTIKGSITRARLNRFYRYISFFKNRGYYSLDDLSIQTAQNKKFIAKDLQKMIKLGMFPEGHLDEQATCMILNQQSYEQYLQLKKNSTMQQTQTKSESTSTTNPETVAPKAPSNSTDKEYQAFIEHGRFCIKQIRDANDAIPGEEISMKLDKLEMIVDKIFTHVAQHPSQLSEINKFMDYYLPTTLKLVTAYKEFDLQPVQGENISSAKKEIEATLDTINHAFETLLDSLFEDAAMDISTDISVLETLLAQEGLTPNNFKTNESTGGNDHGE